MVGKSKETQKMKIHEYQAKEMFKKYNIPVPDGGVAFQPEEAVAVAKKLGEFPIVIKAQVHAGGRGKGGGVQLANTPVVHHSPGMHLREECLYTQYRHKNGY